MSYSLRNIIIGYIAVLAVVVSILFITYSTLSSQENEQNKISKARIALQKLQPALTNVHEVELVSSNYLHKPDEQLLNEYNDVVLKLRDDSITMVMLSELLPENKKEFLQLAALTQNIIIEFGTEMQQFRDNKTTSPRLNSSNTLHSETIKQFKNIASSVEDQNRKLLNTSYSNSLGFTKRTFTFVRVLLVVMLFLLLVTVIFMNKDIKNRKLEEDRLKQFNEELEKQVLEKTSQTIASEQRYRSIIEQATDPIMITDHDGYFQDVNSAMCKQFGYSKEELLTMNIRQLIDPEQLEVKPMRFDLKPGDTVFNERRMMHRDGTIIEVEANVKMLPGLRMLAIARDVTERKNAAEQVMREKNLADSVINSLPGVFFLQDQHGQYIRWNRELEILSGYSTEEISKMNALDFFEGYDKEIARQAIKKVFTEGSFQIEAVATTKHGVQIPFYFTGQLIHYEGEPCVIGTGINIIERKKIEAENERVRYLLKERIKELTTLYRSSQVLQTEEKTIHSLLAEIVKIIPAGWQYTEITAARIALGEMEFKTSNFGPGAHRQYATFSTPEGGFGTVEVVYLEERATEGEDPFHPEERDLLNMIADMIRVSLARKYETEELKKSEANLHTIFDTTDTIYVLLDNNSQVISYNQRAVDFTAKELHKSMDDIKDNFMSYFSPERQPVLSDWLKTAGTGDHVMYEQSYPKSDGTLNWYYVRMFPISGTDKKVFGLMLAVSDITEKKLLEQEIIDQEVQDQKKITRAVLQAQESERNKIGQELHDNVNQILASTKLYLGLLLTDQPDNKELVKQCIEFVEEAISEIRSLSSQEVTPLKEIDLKELLHSLIDQLNHSSGIEAKFLYNVPSELLIEDDLKLNVYRIIQEQINNILKHASAHNATISIEGDQKQLYVRVIDDGIGFDPRNNRKGIGISNMINRVKSYNGEFKIDSSPGKGCRTEIKFPY